jgi:hypothetical protein
MIYSRKPWKLASPADPASTSVVTPRSAPHSDGRIEISVPPCQICTCRSTQPGEIQAPLPSMRVTSCGHRKRRADLGDLAVAADEDVNRPEGVPLPKAIGLTLVRRSGFAQCFTGHLKVLSQSWIEQIAQPVADHLQRQHGENDGKAGK